MKTKEKIKQIDRLDELTPAQEAMMDEVRQSWIEIGLCTDPADRLAAEAAINESYRLAGLEPLQKIVWCGSPLSQGLTRAIVLGKRFWQLVLASVSASVRDSVRDSVSASVGNSVGDSVSASVGDSVWDSVSASVWDSVSASVWDSVSASVSASVRDSVSASVSASVRDSVWDSVWDSVSASVSAFVRDFVSASVRDSVRDSVSAFVRDSVGDSVYGQHDASWLCFYDFFRKCGLIHQTKKTCGLISLAKTAGWALPHERICWISERHNVLVRDNEGRLHNLIGPAIAYPDGWEIYAVHGIRVPADWIKNSEKLDVKTALTWNNVEQRRAAAEILGWERVLNELNPIVIDADRDPMIGALLCVDLPDAPKSKFLKVKCGTGRTFVLAVPEHMTTALQANAWTYGLESNEYDLEIRT